jgi:hypothetical protein
MLVANTPRLGQRLLLWSVKSVELGHVPWLQSARVLCLMSTPSSARGFGTSQTYLIILLIYHSCVVNHPHVILVLGSLCSAFLHRVASLVCHLKQAVVWLGQSLPPPHWIDTTSASGIREHAAVRPTDVGHWPCVRITSTACLPKGRLFLGFGISSGLKQRPNVILEARSNPTETRSQLGMFQSRRSDGSEWLIR